MKPFRLLAVVASLLVAPAAGAQLLSTGDAPHVTMRPASRGPGQGVLVTTPTTLTQVGFWVGSPNGGTLKFFIFDNANLNLLFSTTMTVGTTANGTLTRSNPFSLNLAAGQTYYFGIISDNALNVDYFSPPASTSQNGLTVAGVNTNYSNFSNPTPYANGAASIALALYGQQGSTVPEPSAVALLGTGLVGLVPVVRRRRG